ncbi:hypothetical protein BC831DRAFT_118215 [Entophlyctis helioformis]|nr:hypothetical protein BC831DRAFT_118215 [Entophlyctis helioformis]
MPDQVRGRSWFGEEWLGKGFVFRDTIDLAYGLVQLKGGPCGLLAAVQAHVIKNLVNATAFTCVANGRLRPTVTHARLALIQSIAEMAWQAGKHANRAVIVITSAGVASGDALTDSLEYHTFTNYAATAGFIESHISQFMTHDGPSHGIIQLLLSLILSRGVDRIRQDMDTAEQTLMGRHSYCTQDMVNLALMGAAISNLHDGDVHLGGDTVLKGVHSRADIGQLSLFEHYNNIRVGDHVKNPVHPIFVICSESHYTVLFGLDALPTARDLGHKTRFDVFYYDGLANQPEEIRLTVTSKAAVAGGHGGSPGAGGAATDAMYGRSAGKSVGPGRDHDDLEPPIELCLRTKWVNAHVDWNGTEPLL